MRVWNKTFFLLCIISFGFFSSISHAYSISIENPWSEIIRGISAEHPDIPKKAIQKAFQYLSKYPAQVENQNYLTIIDFNQPSTNERMYVIDLKTAKVFTYLVSHGKASGDHFATRFSNKINSHMSSLGIYLTGDEFNGEHGPALILRGQESTNSNAEVRSIVMHGADYVSYNYIKRHGKLGTSWGCPAVNPSISSELVRILKNGSVFYIYHSQLDRKKTNFASHQ